MKILLFDMHTAGHHLTYGKKLLSKLSEKSEIDSVHFCTAQPTEKTETIFDDSEIRYLFDEGSPVTDRLEKGYYNTRDKLIQNLFSNFPIQEYDIIHLLYMDDLFKYIPRHTRKDDMPHIVGTINGAFFRLHSRRKIKAGELFLKNFPQAVIERIVPDLLSRRPPWNYMSMNICLSNGCLDHLFVHSEAARREVERLMFDSQYDSITVVPDPLETVDELRIDQNEAKKELDVPTSETILLFFGEIRNEKGLDFLLESLETYGGPSFTLWIAGKPADIDPDLINKVNLPNTRVKTELDYIPESDIPIYFNAADIVILPYKKTFGKWRTSGVFQTACSFGRPLIAPDYGVLGNKVKANELGVVFEPESTISLNSTIAKAVGNSNSIYSKDGMIDYRKSHTYDQLANKTSQIYTSLEKPE